MVLVRSQDGVSVDRRRASALERRDSAAEAGSGRHSTQLAEIQRARLIAGAISAIEELGYTHTTVAHITSRSRVSRRTFYELFANREECLTAVLQAAVARVNRELAASELDGLVWREQVRVGLAAILGFFDSEPALARVCVVQALRGGPRVLEYREQLLGRLASVIDQGRQQGTRGRQCTPLIAEGLVGAAFAIVYARLLRGERRALLDLLGELMGMIVLPYLGPAAARHEQDRPAPPSRRVGHPARTTSHRHAQDPLRNMPMRLTYRTARVLEGVAAHPGASNRTIANYAGIADQGQISKLLARLERVGLLINAGEGHAKGEPNAWMLTTRGAELAHSIHLQPQPQERAA